MISCKTCTHKNICRYEESFKLISEEVNNEHFTLECNHKQDELPIHKFRDFKFEEFKPSNVTCKSAFEDIENGDIIY